MLQRSDGRTVIFEINDTVSGEGGKVRNRKSGK